MARTKRRLITDLRRAKPYHRKKQLLNEFEIDYIRTNASHRDHIDL